MLAHGVHDQKSMMPDQALRRSVRHSDSGREEFDLHHRTPRRFWTIRSSANGSDPHVIKDPAFGSG
jgi:hypothetical protein